MRKLRCITLILLFSLVLVACGGEGDTYLYDTGAHTHVYGNRYDVTPETCICEGTQIRYCKICHQAVTDTVAVPEDIAARKHAFSDTVVAPTEAEEGYTKRSCTLCEYVIERTDVIPARYALLTDAATKTEAPNGVSGILMSDTATHKLSYSVGGEGAVSPVIARRLAVALAITEELERQGTALTPETLITLVSGMGEGNSYTVRELLYEWVASGDIDVARGFAMALDGSEAAFAARVAARLEKLGVLAQVTVDPFAPEAQGAATLHATGVMLARALDVPLLCEAFSNAVPGLVRIAGKKPALYLSVGGLRISAMKTDAGVYHFLLLSGENAPSNLENTLFLAVL
ncbi:MAG: hypothetical protein IKA06_07145 [Clostridia bacterium]|nr:hypothetical protein [Clostridia bacterium]